MDVGVAASLFEDRLVDRREEFGDAMKDGA
jgi:hypothetical protein